MEVSFVFVLQNTCDVDWADRAQHMLEYFRRIEHCEYCQNGSSGHGFAGYLHTSQPNLTMLWNQPQQLAIIKRVAIALGKDPDRLPEILGPTEGDLNAPGPRRDKDQDLWNFVYHYDKQGRRTASAAYLKETLNATNKDGSKKYPLTIQFNSLVTKVLFAPPAYGKEPRATGVAYLTGKSMYSADPRYDPGQDGTPGQVHASREVIVAGGTFNTPQILKLSGIGPKEELSQYNIPVVSDLPGVGMHLRDNYGKSSSLISHYVQANCTRQRSVSLPTVRRTLPQ
jgi:choline dehydrogenase